MSPRELQVMAPERKTAERWLARLEPRLVVLRGGEQHGEAFGTLRDEQQPEAQA
jgi:hypothetical protein